METIQNVKKWNKEVIYSIISLLLAPLSYFGLASLLDLIDPRSVAVFRFDIEIHNLTHGDWWYPSYDLSIWIPMVIGLLFLVLALYMGLKSTRKTSQGVERGRIWGIVSATISAFILAVILLLTIFPL